MKQIDPGTPRDQQRETINENFRELDRKLDSALEKYEKTLIDATERLDKLSEALGNVGVPYPAPKGLRWLQRDDTKEPVLMGEAKKDTPPWSQRLPAEPRQPQPHEDERLRGMGWWQDKNGIAVPPGLVPKEWTGETEDVTTNNDQPGSAE